MKNYNYIIKQLMLKKILNEHNLLSNFNNLSDNEKYNILKEYRGGGGESWTQQISSSMGELGPLFDIFSDFAKVFIKTGLKLIVNSISIPAMGAAGLIYGKKGQAWWVKNIQNRFKKSLEEAEWLTESGALVESMRTIAAVPLFTSVPFLYFLVLNPGEKDNDSIINTFVSRYADVGDDEREEKEPGMFDTKGQREKRKSDRERAQRAKEEEEEEKQSSELEEEITSRNIPQDLINKSYKSLEEYIRFTIQSGFVGLKEFEDSVNKSIQKTKLTENDIKNLCKLITSDKEKEKILKDWEIDISKYDSGKGTDKLNRLAVYSEIFKELKSNSKKIVDSDTAKHGKNIIGKIDYSKNGLIISLAESGTTYTDKQIEQNFKKLFDGLAKNSKKFISQQDLLYESLVDENETAIFKRGIVDKLELSLKTIQDLTDIDWRSKHAIKIKKDIEEAKDFVEQNTIEAIAARYKINY